MCLWRVEGLLSLAREDRCAWLCGCRSSTIQCSDRVGVLLSIFVKVCVVVVRVL